jgi:hypothetical protein
MVQLWSLRRAQRTVCSVAVDGMEDARYIFMHEAGAVRVLSDANYFLSDLFREDHQAG